jgi:hypothetical protein
VNGQYNTGIGHAALQNNVSGNFNTAIGYFTQYYNTTGRYNTSLGSWSLLNHTTGEFNTAIGYSNQTTNTGGAFITTLGAYANVSVDSLTYATAIGADAVVAQSNSIVLGRSTDKVGIGTSAPIKPLDVRSPATGSSDWISGVFGPTAVGDRVVMGNLDSKATIGAHNSILDTWTDLIINPAGGRVGIGTNTPGAVVANSKLDVIGGHILISNDYGVLSANASGDNYGAGFDTGAGNELYLYAGGTNRATINPLNGDLTLHNGTAYKTAGGSWIATSDRRLKSNILTYERGLSDIMKINPVKFNYNALSGYDTDEQFIGVVAQELKEVAPYMVGTFEMDGVEYYNVDNSAMTYMLINAVQELSKLNVQTQTQLSSVVTRNNLVTTLLEESNGQLASVTSNYLELKKNDDLQNETLLQVTHLVAENDRLSAQNEDQAKSLSQIQELLKETLEQLAHVKDRLSELEASASNR